MSKKVFNVFSILCFALVLCFIGCTELINPKTETDINLNIDLSKIIKSTRNTGETQSSASLGENPTIKVAIYDAKKYNATTNSTGNLDLITEAQAQIVDNEAKVKLNNIPVGIYAIVFAELSFSNGNSTEVMYAGNSKVFKVKASDNEISLVLMKVVNSETYPDDSNTPYENYTLYKKTENGEEKISNDNEATISTSSTGETKVIVNNLDISESVWTYFVKPNNNTRFTASANYKVSVELKADKTTVVGIAAARADYFFTVNSDWTPCEFETGYVKGSTDHDFTIGLGLSSEIEIRNLKIEKLETTDTTEPSLVFDISKYAINSYLEQYNRPKNIVDVTKEATNGSYDITINTPMCHSTGNSTGNPTGTDDSYIQDVKLHLRSYATETTGANNVSFNITDHVNDFETSVMADTADEKSTAWNNNATKISKNNDGNFSVDFPNYKANDELTVGLITSSTSINNSTSFKLSNFKVEVAGPSPFSDKIFAIQVGNNWVKSGSGASFSTEVTINVNARINFDVGLFNGFNNDNNNNWTPSDFGDVTRFLYKGKNLPDGLSYGEEAGPKFIITNNSDSEKMVKISLNEMYEVVIEEFTSISGGGIPLNEISSWDDLVTKINDDTTTTEFIIMNDLTATSTITVSKPVKITSDKNVTITRGNSSGNTSFTDVFFKVETSGSLELEGKENSTITLDGGNANESPILATAPLITSSGNLTLTNCTLQNNKNTSDTPGGAINISAGTFTMNGGIIGEEITERDGKQSWQYAATDSDFSNYAYAGGGGIYVEDGTVTINGGKISHNYTRNPETDCGGNIPENTAHGGGISIVKGSLSLINSEVSYNSGYQGGGIRCYNDNTSNAGTLTLNKTLIKGNTSNPYNGSSFGGGLMVKNFNVTFEETTESTIEQNYSGDGGALFLENTTSTLKNITIQNNSYYPNGYHYGSELLLWANANVSIDDSNVNIASTEVETRGIFINNNANTLNLSGGAKLDAPVYLMRGTTVTVAGYLSSNTPPVATITPEKYEEGTQVLTADGTTLLAQCVDKFALSDETYSIGNDGMIASNQSGAISLTQAYLDEKLTKTNVYDESYYELEAGEYCVSANLILKYPIQINASGGEVKLYADGDYTISCAENFNNSANSAMIVLPMSAGTLTLGGGNGTLTIDGTTNSTTNLDYLVMSSGTFNLSDKVTITNGNVNFGAVYIGGGTFNMTGGEIKYNKATQSSYSGIYVLGNINITGGSICDNYVEETNNGASIYNNISDEITVLDQKISANGGHFTKNIIDGEVKDVTTSGGGNESLIEGAYYVSAYGNDSNDGLTAEKPLLTLSSAIEKANNSDSKTVYVIGELVGDEASYSGFYISKDVGTNDSPINIIGYPDEIDDVLTVGDNAGRRVVFVNSNSYITFKDLTITGGNVDQSGSAMNLSYCTVTLDNVTITGNSSSSSCTFGSNTYYSDGIEVGSNCTLNIIKSSITNNIRVSGASDSPANVTIGTECYVSNIYLVSDSSTCTFDSNMKINGTVYICSTSANPPVPAIYLSSSLSNYSSDNRIIITYEDCSVVVNKQLISLKDGANFNLADEVKKFTLSDANYTISDEGIVVQNSGGYSL